MSDEKKEPWLNYLALATVVLAVCATLATFKAGGFSTRSVMSQNQASDQWAYFQSKSIKGYVHELTRDQLALELKALGPNAPVGIAADYRRKIEDYGRKIAKYETEKAQIQEEARRLERIRDDCQRHNQTFGIAVIFLQIAILLSSIAAVLKRKPVWYLGLAVGVVGLVYFTNGFFVLF
jgi:hypothetical protein